MMIVVWFFYVCCAFQRPASLCGCQCRSHTVRGTQTQAGEPQWAAPLEEGAPVGRVLLLPPLMYVVSSLKLRPYSSILKMRINAAHQQGRIFVAHKILLQMDDRVVSFFMLCTSTLDSSSYRKSN